MWIATTVPVPGAGTPPVDEHDRGAADVLTTPFWRRESTSVHGADRWDPAF
jgi:hypothetical protein